MPSNDTKGRRIHSLWWAAIMFATIIGFVLFTSAQFAGAFNRSFPVTVTSDRAGLVMEPGAKVKVRGVPVGRVAAVRGGSGSASLQLELDPDQAALLPSNVQAQIRATTLFGAKYVDLVYPADASSTPLQRNAVLVSRNVTTEVNTVFENLVSVLDQIDPPKLNAILTALAEGVRGQGERIGEATTDANLVLTALNDRAETIGADWRSFKGFNDAYAPAAQDILDILRSASVTGETITEHASDLDALLINVTGLAHSGIELLGASHDDLIHMIGALKPTTGLLRTYDPTYTCALLGAQWVMDHVRQGLGGNGKSVINDVSFLFGDDTYRYPDHLPIVAAKGGPGGKPSCGSLPDVTKNFPVRQLITNTGWGTGLDIRPNPGIGHPCWANYFPVTRAVPQPPSIRQCLPGPAPGPVPYPGAPPYGAALYGPGGEPLWPGVPPAPAPPGSAATPPDQAPTP